MPLIPLKFKPGINKDLTPHSNESGWIDMDKVRFRFGYPEKIGGWLKRSASYSFLGSCRALMSWVTLDKERYIGVGTNLKYYIERGGQLFDITPLRYTSSANILADVSIDFSGDRVPLYDSLEGSVGTVVAQYVDDAGTVTGVSATGSANAPLDVFTSGTNITIKNFTGVEATGSVGTLVDYGDYVTKVSVTGVEATGSTRGIYAVVDQDDTDDIVFSTVAGDATITVTCAKNHGAETGDFVTFSGAETIDATITADVLNQEYQITRISAVRYTFEARQAGTSIQDITDNGSLNPTAVTATTTGSGGGVDTVAKYQINIGKNISQQYNGWDAGTWGSSPWGQTIAEDSLRLWHHNNFGEDLILNYRDGPVFYWDASAGIENRAVNITDLANANKAPTVAKQVLVSDRDRHVIAFGCDPEFAPGVQDPLIIRFSDSESPTDWETRATNTAGEIRLGLGSEIIQAVETKQQILVFTDTTLYAMQFLGPPYTFGVTSISEKISIQSPNAAIAVDDVVIWMGADEFYVFQGSVQKLPCTIRDFVFDNLQQGEKVVAGLNAKHSEVWWFYPSADNEITNYVVYNYQEQVWSHGTMPRTAWMDRGLYEYPIAASTDGYLYEHENGFNDGSDNTAITAYIESAPFDLGEGDKFMFVRKLIPDVSYLNSSSILNPSLNFGFKTQQYPGSAPVYLNERTPYPTEATSSTQREFSISNAIQRAYAKLEPEETLFKDAEATSGIPLGNISQTGTLSFDDVLNMNKYINYKYLNSGVRPSGDFEALEDYIENTMIPYMLARPNDYAKYYKPNNSTASITGQYLISPETTDNNYVVTPSKYTEKVDMRLRGRSLSLTVWSDDTNMSWRLGTPRLEVRPDGRR